MFGRRFFGGRFFGPRYFGSGSDGGGGGATLAACSTAVGSVADEFVETDDSGVRSIDGTNIRLSQSWESPSSAREVTGVCLRAYRLGSPGGTFKVEVYAHSGIYGVGSRPTGGVLVSSVDLDPGTMGTSVAEYFIPLTGWEPSDSTQYVLVVNGDDLTGLDASNRLTFIVESGAEADHGGNHGWFTSSWLVSSSQDMAFKIYETTTPVTGVARAATFIRNAIRIGF